MGTIKQPQIQWLVNYMLENKIFIYHACQYLDLKSFAIAGGVISKAEGKVRGYPLTPYTSDARDTERGVDTAVFFNFGDFGYYFHNGYKALPNVYGPILLKFSPYVLYEAAEVSVTLTSISDNDLDRERDSLDLDDVKKIFKGRFAKNKGQLEEAFPGRKINTPEMNVRYQNQIASFHNLTEVLCDPLTIDDHSLAQLVRNELKKYSSHNHLLVKERISINQDLYNNLVTGTQKAKDWLNTINLPPHIKQNFFNYLRIGTINHLEEELNSQREIL